MKQLIDDIEKELDTLLEEYLQAGFSFAIGNTKIYQPSSCNMAILKNEILGMFVKYLHKTEPDTSNGVHPFDQALYNSNKDYFGPDETRARLPKI